MHRRERNAETDNVNSSTHRIAISHLDAVGEAVCEAVAGLGDGVGGDQPSEVEVGVRGGRLGHAVVHQGADGLHAVERGRAGACSMVRACTCRWCVCS